MTDSAFAVDDPAVFSGLVAPVVDRIAISVHPAVDKDAIDALRGDLKFRPAAMTLFAGAIAGGTVSAHEYSELNRYEHFGPGGPFLEGLAARGAITIADDGSFTGTPDGVSVAKSLVTLQSAAAAQLFAPRAASWASLRSMMDRCCDAAATDPLSPLGAYARRSWMPNDASDAAHIWNDCVVLRMHRSDAHARAWVEQGLTAQQAKQLPVGAHRDAIEARTNELAAVPWVDLSAHERTVLLAGLAALPGVGSPI
jgi:hypothetical protein